MSNNASEKEYHEVFGQVEIPADSVYPIDGPNPRQLYIWDDDWKQGGGFRPFYDVKDVDVEIIQINLQILPKLCVYSDWDFTQFLSLTLLHEYCHWALTEEENSELEENQEHSYRWNSVLVEELEYITGEALPRATIDPDQTVRLDGDAQDPTERNITTDSDVPF